MRWHCLVEEGLCERAMLCILFHVFVLNVLFFVVHCGLLMPFIV